MDAVEVAVAVACGAVVIVVVVFAALRGRSRREVHSVTGYRQTLDVLGHLGGAERGVAPHGGEEGEAPRATPYERSRTVPPVTFDDLGTEAPRRIHVAFAEPPRRDRSLSVMERPARRLGVPLLALVLILAVGGGVAYLAVHSHHPAHHPKSATSSHSHRHTPTGTTLPATYTAVSSTSSSATYVPVTSSYSLTVGATTSQCWMSVTEANGTTLLAQTFAPGATDSLTLTGHSTIVIGAPASAKVTIGGVPVVLPKGVPGPFTVTLSPS